MPCVLLQIAPSAKPPAGGDTKAVLLWVFVLIVLVMGLGVAIMIVRRRMFAKDASAFGQQTFMEDLRRMRDRGEISPEEFEATKKTMVARLRGSAAPPRPPKHHAPGPPDPSG